jgi:hypothetical protein
VDGLVRIKSIKLDTSGKLRSYQTRSDSSIDDAVAWYFDEAGGLRFIWDHGTNQRTFLAADGQLLWSWRRDTRTGVGEFGLDVVNPEHVVLGTAPDARATYESLEANCIEMVDSDSR